jgi:formate--tetrahydrofolate ligase
VLNETNNFAALYDVEESINNKVLKIVQQVYGGKDVIFTDQAQRNIKDIERNGWDLLPICMAKTQYSFSDEPKLLGRPEGFSITVREIIPKLGAGFLVCLTGDIMTMPGLPKAPAALNMDVDENGNAIGLM